MKSISRLLLASLFVFCVSSVKADDPKASKASKPALRKTTNEKDWSLEIGGGYVISDIRTDLPGYDLVLSSLTASTVVDEVGLDNFAGGIFRGYTEFYFKGFGYTVLHGTESRFIGIDLGPRYNFVQPGWKLVPFIDGYVGFGFTDSQGAFDARGQIGQGQDFCFNFGVTAGATYNFNDSYFLRLSVLYTHFSNAGLSEPGRKNRALDGIGPELSVGYRF
jgi:opacity protein-like surface antigen